MEAGLLKIPGAFQPRQGLCCLGCAVKPLKVDDYFVFRMVLTRSSLTDALNDTLVRYEIDRMTPFQRKAVYAIVDSLVDLKGKDNAPIVHPLFFQRQTLPLALNDREVNYNFAIGQIRRGCVLEIFQATNNDPEAGQIMQDLVDEGMQLDWKVLGVRWLRYRYPSVCVCISTIEGAFKVSWGYAGGIRKTSSPLEHGLDNLNELFQELKQRLISINSVSLIIVDKINCGFQDGRRNHNPGAQRWIDFFSTVYGSTDDLFIVLGIVYEDFHRLGITSKLAVKGLINRDLKQREKVQCLDLSSSIDNLPEQQGNIIMELFDPPQ